MLFQKNSTDQQGVSFLELSLSLFIILKIVIWLVARGIPVCSSCMPIVFGQMAFLTRISQFKWKAPWEIVAHFSAFRIAGWRVDSVVVFDAATAKVKEFFKKKNNNKHYNLYRYIRKNPYLSYHISILRILLCRHMCHWSDNLHMLPWSHNRKVGKSCHFWSTHFGTYHISILRIPVYTHIGQWSRRIHLSFRLSHKRKVGKNYHFCSIRFGIRHICLQCTALHRHICHWSHRIFVYFRWSHNCIL